MPETCPRCGQPVDPKGCPTHHGIHTRCYSCRTCWREDGSARGCRNNKRWEREKAAEFQFYERDGSGI